MNDLGSHLDPRASFANERTLLAWVRTGLGLIAGGLAATELLPKTAIAGAEKIIGVALVVAGGVLVPLATAEWWRRERAIREGRSIQRSPLPLLLTASVTLAAIAALVVILTG